MSNDTAELGLNPATTALVLIDLQNSILAMNTAPHASADVVRLGGQLAQKCRERGVAVVLVTVGFRADGKDRLAVPTDTVWRPSVTVANPTALADDLKTVDSDILVLKHQWGAFYGTDLDLQLRRRGIDTILLGGIATNFGVESTARDAWERSYKVVFVEDAMTSVTAEAHQFSVSTVFPRLGRVRSSAQVLAALG
jgi:nicotinamidase-related amidase